MQDGRGVLSQADHAKDAGKREPAWRASQDKADRAASGGQQGGWTLLQSLQTRSLTQRLGPHLVGQGVTTSS